MISGKRIFEGAKCYFALTTAEKRDFTKWGISEDKIETVPNGVHIREKEKQSSMGSTKQNSVSNNETTVLYLGRIHERKGVDILVEAVTEVEGVNLLIAGPDDGYAGEIDRIVSERDLEEKVKYLGFISEEKKEEVYNECDIFVLPSPYGEGLPTTILEAAAFGSPIVATPACNVGFIEDIGGGRIVEPEVDSIALALAELASDQFNLDRMGYNAKMSIENRFSWNTIAGNVEEIYKSIITVTR
jgi:glycosyltransferase involved in cell wall biosynthesis